MMKFSRQELPIAYSMIEIAGRVRPRRDGRQPFDQFFLLWTAFKHIYTAVASRHGVSTQYLVSQDGSIATTHNGSINIPKVIPVDESEQLSIVLGELDDKLQHRLITHESTYFFLNRVPFWQGKPIEVDAFGQKLNGIININDTTRPEYPVWSPIDALVYERYMQDPEKAEDRTFLAGQIMDLLHTVSKNLMHLGQKFDDGNDIHVVENALPLLEQLIETFIDSN